MFPKLFSFKTPDFLHGFLPDTLSVNSYGFFIALGLIFAFYIILHKTKNLGINPDNLSSMFLWCFLAAFVGGKLFFYLEDPMKYVKDPALLTKNIGNGFVFYGSLVCVVPTIYWWLRKHQIPFWPFMDGVAFGGPVLHSLGRIGCFMAGCCHGRICNNALGVVFSHPDSVADPKNVPLYPTQLFDIGINLITLLVVFLVSKKKQFEGQLFLIYIILYAIGRAINEHFRGDEERGYLFGGLLSYSQFIAILLIIISAAIWYKKSRNLNQEAIKADD